MATALIIGDPHFKVSNVRETDIMVEDILRYAETLAPTFIVVLGDVLDRHETIHVNPLTRAIDFLKSLSSYAVTFVLIGNHDLKNNQEFLSTEHPFTALKSWDQVVVVDSPIQQVINGLTFTFVPYVPPGRFVEALARVPEWASCTCIFAHQEFRGCQMGPMTSTEGDVWSTEAPLVISGHIHDYQQPQGNIFYPGTPIQHTYSDRQDKGIILGHFPKFQSNRLPLSVPLKHIVRLNYNQLTTPPEISGEAKIIISGTSAELKNLVSHPMIGKWKDQGHKVVFKTLAQSIPVPTMRTFSYRQELIRNLRDQPQLLALYEELFPSQ